MHSLHGTSVFRTNGCKSLPEIQGERRVNSLNKLEGLNTPADSCRIDKEGDQKMNFGQPGREDIAHRRMPRRYRSHHREVARTEFCGNQEEAGDGRKGHIVRLVS